jgi:hypothetical protein
MKKMILACAIVLVCFNFIGCTEEPLLETVTEQSTTGENSNDEEPPPS